MGKIVTYEHHGFNVKVDEELKGKHREHCLCFRCVHFHPNELYNCGVADKVFGNCQQYGLTTPVYECPFFEKK